MPEAGGSGAPAIDGFTDLVQVGRGGFGTVYRGHQRDIGRIVAIKVLAGQAQDAEAQRRFRREVTAMVAISHHPNVVPVYAIGTAGDGRPFLVMPYLPGGTLADRLGTLSWREMVDLGSKMSGALEAAHHVGVLHRDVKPANILWSAWNEPQLADFGIAWLHDTTRTAPGLVIASLTWAAPEVLEGRAASPASDVYALAAALHAGITGRSPHAAGPDEPMAATVARIASQPAQPLTAFGVPKAVSDVISAALAKDPAQRPPTARAFGDALVAAAAADPGSGPAPTPVPAVEPTPAPEPLLVMAPPPDSGPSSVPVVAATASRAPAEVPTVQAPVVPEPLLFDSDQWSATASSRDRRRPGRVVALLGVCLAAVVLGLAVRHFVMDRGQPSRSASRPTSTSSVPSTSRGSTGDAGDGGVRGSGTSSPATTPTSSATSTSTSTTSTSPSTTTTSTTSTTTTPATAPPTTAPGPVGQGGAATARESLLSYYDRVGQGDYATTWSQLTPSYQRRTGGYAAYTRFWRNYDRVDVSDIRLDGDLAATATLHYHQTNGATVRETGRFRFVRGASGALVIDAYRVSARAA